jgi:hypothetical protein
VEHDKVYSEASEVHAVKGQVTVDGPDGVAVSLTPEAAVETAARLEANGIKAAGQRRAGEGHDRGEALRRFDDDTLLDMYEHAHDAGDEHCDAIAAELTWRGIVVKPCGKVHMRGFAGDASNPA